MLIQLIITAVLIAAVVFYFIRRNRKLKEMETEDRLRDIFR
jgi:large-conductance mechanosensitive channel